MSDQLRARAKELLELGNNIEDKINQVAKLESDIEKLQVYRNERGEQLLRMLIDSRNYETLEAEK